MFENINVNINRIRRWDEFKPRLCLSRIIGPTTLKLSMFTLVDMIAPLKKSFTTRIFWRGSHQFDVSTLWTWCDESVDYWRGSLLWSNTRLRLRGTSVETTFSIAFRHCRNIWFRCWVPGDVRSVSCMGNSDRMLPIHARLPWCISTSSDVNFIHTLATVKAYRLSPYPFHMVLNAICKMFCFQSNQQQPRNHEYLSPLFGSCLKKYTSVTYTNS